MSKAECKKGQESALRLFTRCKNNLLKSIKTDESFDVVQRKFKELSQRYTDVQLKHEEYVISIEEETDFNQTECDAWMDAVDETFDETEKMACDYLTLKGNLKVEKDTQQSDPVILPPNVKGEEEQKFYNLREFENAKLLNEIKKVKKLLEYKEIY